ncbi:unnamed protein product [Parascedosporium putredinis]|uniref:Uncharacterized protein n=1 Tax=Parascedosporium putredinis TaxID=1442378 RepID=A0A9P1M8V3_9PEZI|nr:unnamed protein product [Parascedosporium putredinis]CAI7994334.1 unnamed protein product [Parascedosporium putredinis]
MLNKVSVHQMVRVYNDAVAVHLERFDALNSALKSSRRVCVSHQDMRAPGNPARAQLSHSILARPRFEYRAQAQVHREHTGVDTARLDRVEAHADPALVEADFANHACFRHHGEPRDLGPGLADVAHEEIWRLLLHPVPVLGQEQWSAG